MARGPHVQFNGKKVSRSYLAKLLFHIFHEKTAKSINNITHPKCFMVDRNSQIESTFSPSVLGRTHRHTWSKKQELYKDDDVKMAVVTLVRKKQLSHDSITTRRISKFYRIKTCRIVHNRSSQPGVFLPRCR